MKSLGLFTITGISLLMPFAYSADVEITGDKKQWHKTVLLLSGPSSSATANPNPFLDFRFNVTFTAPSGKKYLVPGYYAGDGNGAGTGNKWASHLNASEVGTWSYKVSLRSGKEVAVSLQEADGTALAPYDGQTGEFSIAPSDKSGEDFRAPDRGMLINRGHHYLTFVNNNPFVHAGNGICENVLGYRGFTNTTVGLGHKFTAHEKDWQPGDPDWDNGKGKAIIGMFNYMAKEGGNNTYFQSYTLDDDGRDTFPNLEPASNTGVMKEQTNSTEIAKLLRYDLLKLKQWDIALGHAQSKGIFFNWHFTEHNNIYAHGGNVGGKSVMTPQRKLYFRMMVAYFGHYNGLVWNIGEECDFTFQQFIDQVAFVKAIDPYDHPTSFQVGGAGQDLTTFPPHYGNKNIDMVLPQFGKDVAFTFNYVVEARRASAAKGNPMTATYEEPQTICNNLTETTGYGSGRRYKMWPWMMAGGDGFQWYVQLPNGGHAFDQQIDDFSAMKPAFNFSRNVRQFLAMLPLLQGTSSMDKVKSTTGDDFTLYLEGQTYGIYNTKSGSGMTLDLTGVSGDFSVQWFDPRAGGALLDGSVTTIAGGGQRSLGNPPKDAAMDWAVLVKNKSSEPVRNQAPQANAGSAQSIFLKDKAALAGFALDDGLPESSALTYAWSTVAAPNGATATFDNAKVASTGVRFSAAGSYTLRLTVSDGQLSDTSDLVVTVKPNPVGNTAPTIQIDQQRVAKWQSSTTDIALDASVSDDGLPNPPAKITAEWTVVTPVQSNGNPTVTFANRTSVGSSVRLSEPGKYVLRLAVSDGALSSTANVELEATPAQPDRPVVDDVAKIVSGAGEMGASAVIYLDNVKVKTVLITKSDGTWSTTLSGLTAGEHEVTYAILLNGSASTVSDGAIITGAVEGANAAPQITMDAKFTTDWVSATTPVSLTATVSDDGLPANATVSYLWSVVAPNQNASGSPRLTIATPTSEDTKITASAPGIYTLRLRASDGVLSQTDDIDVELKPAKPGPAAISASASRPVLSGKTTVGATVTVLVDGSQVHGTVPVTAGDGSWSYTLKNLTVGDHTVAYTVTVNRSVSSPSASQSVKITSDTTTPPGNDDPTVPKDPSGGCGQGGLAALFLLGFATLQRLGRGRQRGKVQRD